MLGNGGAGGHLSSIGPCCPSLVLAVRAALSQQDPSITLDDPDDLSRRHQSSLVPKHFQCLAYKHYA